ncbi:MAG TPA: hypothetical protein V6C57_08305, partial [Coleofasciculaceae cyanobacterium]
GLEPLPDAKVLLPALNVEELADSSRALLYEEDAAPPMPEPSAPPVRSSWKPVPSGVRLLALLVLGLVAAVLGLAIWQQMNPSPPPPPPTQSS